MDVVHNPPPPPTGAMIRLNRIENPRDPAGHMAGIEKPLGFTCVVRTIGTIVASASWGTDAAAMLAAAERQDTEGCIP